MSPHLPCRDLPQKPPSSAVVPGPSGGPQLVPRRQAFTASPASPSHPNRPLGPSIPLAPRCPLPRVRRPRNSLLSASAGEKPESEPPVPFPAQPLGSSTPKSHALRSPVPGVNSTVLRQPPPAGPSQILPAGSGAGALRSFPRARSLRSRSHTSRPALPRLPQLRSARERPQPSPRRAPRPPPLQPRRPRGGNKSVSAALGVPPKAGRLLPCPSPSSLPRHAEVSESGRGASPGNFTNLPGVAGQRRWRRGFPVTRALATRDY